MKLELMGYIVFTFLIFSLVSGMLIWFILPKKWIAWSPLAGSLLRQDTIPQWVSLNWLGKTLYVVFVGSAVSCFAIVVIGTALQEGFI